MENRGPDWDEWDKGHKTICQNPQLSDSKLNFKKKRRGEPKPQAVPDSLSPIRAARDEAGSFTKAMAPSFRAKGAT